MGVNIKNAEGYYDPTTYEALTNIEKERKQKEYDLNKFRPLVYICSPFSGDVRGNTEAARKYSRFAVNAGYIPVTPHLLYPQFLDDNLKEERELGLLFGKVLLDKCDQIWVCGNTVSDGMKAEIERAERKRYIIRYFTSNMTEVKR